ncbi:MAG: hypothetical protein HC859_07905, partial [Bacteroidia bacterium]|nr:hypothetical protein [Bacteroidia bacterium]
RRGARHAGAQRRCAAHVVMMLGPAAGGPHPPLPPTDWTGRLSVSRGAILVHHRIGFEDRTDAVLPRDNRASVSFISVTTTHSDGLALRIIDPTPTAAEPLTLTYSLRGGAQYTIDVAALTAGPQMVDVDGDNKLDGAAGNDEILGHEGEDTLIGGRGADKLTGGLGRDIFEFANVNEAGDKASEVIAGALKPTISMIRGVCVGGGMSLFDEERTHFTHFPFEADAVRPDGSYFMVLSIFQQGDTFWIGAFNSGLWALSYTDSLHYRVRKVNVDDAVNNGTVYSTLPDKAGNLWLSTNQGLARYSSADGHCYHFSKSEGVQDDEFNRLSYLQTKNGELCFGGINGFNLFDPQSIALNLGAVAPVLLSLTASATTIIFSNHLPARSR